MPNMMIISVIIFFFLYIFVSIWMLFTSSLWTLYFGLELQWMLCMILIIIGSLVWSGLSNYLMFNGILSILSVIGILLSNLMMVMFGCLGKIGYSPSYLMLGYQYYSSSYIWIIFDLMNKWAYFGSFMCLMNHSMLVFMNFINWFVLMNFFIIMFFIKFILSIKHLILISSMQLFLLILCGLYFKDLLYSFSFLLFYSITMIYLLLSMLLLENMKEALNLSLLSFYSSFIPYFTPFFIMDLSNLKQSIIIIMLLLIIYWLILFSFFPTMMFLSKLFFMLLWISITASIHLYYSLFLNNYFIFIYSFS